VDAHKSSAGHVVAFAGSPGKTGASLLVARGALRAGAGLATIATWAESMAATESRVLEVMTARLAPGDLDAGVAAAIAGKRAAVVGPGFGVGDDARRAVARVLEVAEVPVVVDADALTLYAGRVDALASARRPPILTPHPGEAARLLDTTTQAVEADRFSAARTLARRARATVLLKGVHTLIASPEGRVVVNGSGTAALATAGSGDVLAGIVAALACTLDPFDAAYAAAHVHGLAAEAWTAKNGDRGLLASEIADHVPPVLATLVR
jgi:NAD(P)H-hydrate epimerase